PPAPRRQPRRDGSALQQPIQPVDGLPCALLLGLHVVNLRPVWPGMPKQSLNVLRRSAAVCQCRNGAPDHPEVQGRNAYAPGELPDASSDLTPPLRPAVLRGEDEFAVFWVRRLRPPFAQGGAHALRQEHALKIRIAVGVLRLRASAQFPVPEALHDLQLLSCRIEMSPLERQQF